MTIFEAVTTALDSGMAMKRENEMWRGVKILLTKRELCFLSVQKGMIAGWQPSVADLIADDWILVPEED